jgi:competence protein ComGC
MKTFNTKNKMKGFTLIEFLWVGIALAIAFAVLMANMNSGMEESKLDTMSDHISHIASKVQKCGMANGGRYTKCNYAYLLSRGYLNESWDTSINDPKNPFNGEYDADVDSSIATRFTVSGTDISTDEGCLQLIDRWEDASLVTPTCSSGTITVTLGSR